MQVGIFRTVPPFISAALSKSQARNAHNRTNLDDVGADPQALRRQRDRQRNPVRAPQLQEAEEVELQRVELRGGGLRAYQRATQQVGH
ncbi:unnamed protein product [Sphagnum tenellum]